jgi:hypothetical protein
MDLYTMEFYSATKKNEILSFASKWMDLENIILSKVRFKRPKIVCSPSHVDYRPKTNAVILLEKSHNKGRSHTRGTEQSKETKNKV